MFAVVFTVAMPMLIMSLWNLHKNSLSLKQNRNFWKAHISLFHVKFWFLSLKIERVFQCWAESGARSGRSFTSLESECLDTTFGWAEQISFFSAQFVNKLFATFESNLKGKKQEWINWLKNWRFWSVWHPRSPLASPLLSQRARLEFKM